MIKKNCSLDAINLKRVQCENGTQITVLLLSKLIRTSTEFPTFFADNLICFPYFPLPPHHKYMQKLNALIDGRVRVSVSE